VSKATSTLYSLSFLFLFLFLFVSRDSIREESSRLPTFCFFLTLFFKLFVHVSKGTPEVKKVAGKFLLFFSFPFFLIFFLCVNRNTRSEQGSRQLPLCAGQKVFSDGYQP
jgi:hypothetical protein